MADKRKPKITPGNGLLPSDPKDDFTLPATLYCDAIAFLREAIEARERIDQDVAARSIRAALFCGFAAFEAQLNQIAFAHAHAHRLELDGITLDVLEERESIIDEQGSIVRRTKFYPFESRFFFLVHFLTGRDFNRSGELWQGLKAAKGLRDAWTHPKPPFDSWSLDVPSVRIALMSIRDTLIEISNMLEIDPPNWLSANEIPNHARGS